MRIIAGDARGRRIISPEGKDTRPTSDRVKESLFNILGTRVPSSKVLDLFAGTGNLGLEALSRGAESCIFIDNNSNSIRVIHENIRLLKYEDLCEVYNNDVISAIRILNRRDIKFDIIFADPPYHKNILPDVLKELSDNDVIKIGGVVVTEHDKKDVLPQSIKDLSIYKSSIYGDTVLSFYMKAE